MANQEHLDILKLGVEVWNRWREEHPEIRPDLSGAILQRAYLIRANLSKVDLSDADLSMAWLMETDLKQANLEGTQLFQANLAVADLSGTDLRKAAPFQANFGQATLCGTDFRKVILYGANFRWANLRGADLREADITNAILVDTNLENANLTGCSVYGAAVWNVFLKNTDQDNLVITQPYEATITVDSLEVAQFIYLLLNHKKLRDVLNAVTDRGVLILGRFGSGGIEVLQAIASKLRESNYLPIIFDFDRPQDRNYTETVKTLAGLSRFIIADLSGPSVPQELYATVPHFKIPFVPIIEAGRKPFAMSVDLLEYPWVVRPIVTFATTEELLEQLPIKVIAPAEEKHQARQKLLDELFGTA